MTADTWMPLYVGDYLAATRRLTTEQHGAYLLLIMDYWKQGPLPDDDCTLARITVTTLDGWLILRPFIEPFFQLHAGRWNHKRIDQERSKAKDQYAAVLENSRRGVEARRRLGQLPKEPKVQPKVQPADASGENQRRTPSQPPSPSPSEPQPPSQTHTPPTPSESGVCVSALKKKFQDNGRFEWLEAELCRLYKRPITKVGMGEEEHLVAEVSRRPDVKSEIEELKRCRGEIGERFFPQSLAVLCRDWDKTLDRARNHAPPPAAHKDLSIAEKEINRMAKSLGL